MKEIYKCVDVKGDKMEVESLINLEQIMFSCSGLSSKEEHTVVLDLKGAKKLKKQIKKIIKEMENKNK